MKNKLKTIILISAISSMLLTGCGTDASATKNSTKDSNKYIITRISGGKVMDVWKIQTESKLHYNYDNDYQLYSFTDIKGNIYNVPVSETTIIKCNDNEIWNSYEEYHWNEVSMEINE